MIETPQIVELSAQNTAVVHMRVSRKQLNEAVPPAIEDVLTALGQRGVEPTGPLVMHHLNMADDEFEFELGFPVAAPFEDVEHVVGRTLPQTRALKTVHQGSYDLLHQSWEELHGWLKSHPEHKPASHLWESYVLGPESGLPTEQWRTEMILPVSS